MVISRVYPNGKCCLENAVLLAEMEILYGRRVVNTQGRFHSTGLFHMTSVEFIFSGFKGCVNS